MAHISTLKSGASDRRVEAGFNDRISTQFLGNQNKGLQVGSSSGTINYYYEKLKTTHWIIIAVTCLLVLGGILGGIFGSQAASKSSPEAPTSSTTGRLVVEHGNDVAKG